MPGAWPHPQPCARVKKAHKHSHHRLAETFRHSLRDGFTAYAGLSPETGLDCLRRRPRWISIVANLTPASGRQDHPVLPYATASLAFVICGIHRIPRPTSVTMAKRPSFGCETIAALLLFLANRKAKYF